MKTLHLTIIVILVLVGICSTASTTSGNLTSNFQPSYPKTANLTTYNPPTFPALQAVSPDLLKTLPPLEQSEHGVMAKDITCSKGLQLIFKTKDDSPACVTKQTAQKLVERWWGMYVPAVTEQDIPILSNSIKILNTSVIANYSITGGILSSISLNVPGQLSVIVLQPSDNGTLHVTLPENWISGKIYVLGNHLELLDSSETFDHDHEMRTLSISFHKYDDHITLASESEWSILTNPKPCNPCAFP